MHQYIREQADALAQKRLEEYHQLQAWAAYEFPKRVPSRHDPQRRGGGPHELEPISGQRPLRQQAQRQGSSTKVGIIGSMYPHVVKGMASGEGGGSPPPPGQGGPPEDKLDEGSDEEENEEDDTDEETVSVTTSNQASAGGAGPQKWDRAKETYQEGTGSHQRIQMTQQVEEVQGMVVEDLEVIEANGNRRDPQGRMGLLAPLDQAIFQAI